jgi:hypothetical protein
MKLSVLFFPLFFSSLTFISPFHFLFVFLVEKKMKTSLLFSCALAVIVMALALVQADELQDEVDASLKKFCGGMMLY